ncbi:MMPL family transporter [Frondihabitans sp. PAMC 28766]|uniref:MMPL family transporter n=1 Tax=Frondihabitans sp. PAMC 28766 TaxID=1795630 RepID=UPI0009E785B9|nr:MMPL family transporter [Frondihabitans sp. PAMC 28766]
MASLLARIGGFSAQHRWWVIGAWLVMLIVAAGSAASFSKPLDSTFSIKGLQSIDTLTSVGHEFPKTGGNGGDVVFAAPKGQELTAADQKTVATLSTRLADVTGVTSATDPFTAPAAERTLSPDGRIGYVSVSITASDPSNATIAGVQKAMTAAETSHLQVEASSGLVPDSYGASSQLVGIVIAFVVLLITFGSFLAAGLPLLTALFGLGTSVAAIYASSAFVDLNSTAPLLAILLALAVGLDYALFIVNRHRRNLLSGMGVQESIRLAAGTAGSAVFFAGATVIVALAGLSVVGVGFLSQMGLSAAFGVFVALLVSLTFTPAILSISGTKVLSRRARGRIGQTAATLRRTPASRWVALVTRRPVVFTVAAVAVLAILAVPVAGLRLGLPNDGTDPSGTTTRAAYDLTTEGFGAGFNGPILVLAQHVDAADVPGLMKALDVHDVVRVVPSGLHGTDALFTVIPKTGPSDAATETLVHALRGSSESLGLPATVSLQVTGETAVAIDISQRLLDALPFYLALVAGFAFLLLMVVFRSLLIPLKATLSFLLSFGASLGATVAVFQWGWLGTLFHVDPAAPLLSFLPILLVGVLFGLSMDYEMFLVSGMRERRAQGDTSPVAVSTGFANGAKVVAAAALIMIGVFGNGAIAGRGTIQPLAFALAVGVLVDAFVVRMTLVPAVMRLFGDGAWWLPRWLDRILPDADIEGAGLDRKTAALPAASHSEELATSRA